MKHQSSNHPDAISELLIGFAKLHCNLQKEAIKDNISLTEFACEFLQECASEAIDMRTIENAYPLNNIK
jgi:hypothetical protein